MAMINCPECGKEISDKAKKCVHCGKILIEKKTATKICDECGKENPIDATECMNCGCPFDDKKELEKNVADAVSTTEKPVKKNTKNIIIPIVMATIILVVGLIVYNVKVIKPKNTYNEAMELLEKGKYNDADELLKTIEDYKDVKQIREEVKYESCAYSAVNAVKDILKNPDSISVYEIKFYNGTKKYVESADTVDDSDNENDTLIDEDHPFILIHLGAQNGFGGNAESYALCSYSKEQEEYKLDFFTKSDNIEDIKEDYDEDDDNYFMYLFGAAMVSEYKENGNEVGSIDMNRFKAILKNDAYSAIKIIE